MHASRQGKLMGVLGCRHMARSHLHFVQSLEPLQGGGLGRAALALHTGFSAAGERSTLLATARHRRLDPQDRVFELPRRGPEKLYWSPELRPYAAREMTPGTVIHGHGFYVGPNWVVGGLARKRALPLAYHVHGIFEPWILHRSRLKKRLAHALFENANFRHASLWRALHAKEADQIRSEGITAPIVVAPNGIRTEEFDAAPTAREAGQSRHRVVFLSRLHPKKGLDLLIPAWSRLAPGRRDWELVIAGPDEGGYQATLETMIREGGVESSVEVRGVVSGAAKAGLLKSADIFILPSYSEGFSVAILEALACGVPVIATDACNFPQLTEAGAGWECRPTLESVAQTLERACAESEEERRQRGLAGRRLMEEKYAYPMIAQAILDACDRHCR